METEYPLKNEIVNISLTTLSRLTELGADCLALYMFLVKTAYLQNTTQVKALSCFCMKGLGIGEDRYYKASKLLQENSLIQLIVKKDQDNKIKGNYVLIKYLSLSQSIQSCAFHAVENEETGKSGTNAYNKKINALDKKKILKSKKIQVRDYVEMTEEELERLKNEYGVYMAKEFINKLDNYIASKGVKYKDHNRTIRNWINKEIEEKYYEKKLDNLGVSRFYEYFGQDLLFKYHNA